MKISIEDVDCTGLEIESALESGDLRLGFAGVSDGRGVIDVRSEHTLLDSIAIRELVLATLHIPLAGGGSIETEAPAKLGNASLDGEIRNGLTGALNVGLVGSEKLALNLSDMRILADVHGEELNLVLEPDSGRVHLGHLTLKDLATTVGGYSTTLGTLSITGLKINWSGSKLRVEALKAHAQGLRLANKSVSIEISGIDLAEGFCIDENRVSVPQVLVGQAAVTLSQLSPPPLAETDHNETLFSVALPTSVGENISAKFDTGVFDTVNGQVDVDLTLDATVPVLGKRRATHHFRVPVAGGIINYRELEQDLSDLENAFIDIKLRGHTLAVERDIPLIPGLEKPLILWDLSEGDVDLAKQHLVRLRTLPSFRLPTPVVAKDSSEKAEKKSPVKIRHLDLDAISVELSLDDAPVLTGKHGQLRTSLEHLQLTGELYYRPDDTPISTSIAIAAKGLSAVANALVVHHRRIDGELQLGSIEQSELKFVGLRPSDLRLDIRNMQLRNFGADLKPDQTNTPITFSEVLDFWFGELDENGMSSPNKRSRWFKKSPEFDQQLRDRFLDLYRGIVAGDHDDWLNDPTSALAYVITLDQFSRNMFRGTPQMFSADPQALAAAKQVVDAGTHKTLPGQLQVFLFMPFMHSEDLPDQERAIQLFEELTKESQGPAQESFAANIRYGVAHRDIVRRFGRFPHRNVTLARPSTEEELEFLSQPGSSF